MHTEMSSKRLQEVLSEVSRKGLKAEELRKKAGFYETAFFLSVDQIVGELERQIFDEYGYRRSEKRKLIIRTATERYVESLVSAFKKGVFLKPETKSGFGTIKNSIEVFASGPSAWTIIVSGGDNFRVFKDRKRPYMRILEKEITKGFGIAEKNSPFIKRSTGLNTTVGGLLDLGHFGASEINTNLVNLAFADVAPELERLADKNITLRETLEKVGFSHSPDFIYTIQEESLSDNRRRGALADQRAKEIEKTLLKFDWSNVKGSPSPREEIKRMLKETASKGTAQKRTKVTKVSKETKIPVRRRKVNVGGPDISGSRVSEEKPRNWASLIPEINAKLTARVVSNMKYPSLVNRTGTFAESAKITGVQTTPEGFPSFLMSYDKTPYGVFDRRLGASPWATPERDPYTIIERSLRQVLSGFAIGRFYARRT